MMKTTLEKQSRSVVKSNTRSLSTKITLTVVLLLTIAIGVSAYFLLEYQRNLLMRNMEDFTTRLGSVIKGGLRHTMLEHGNNGVQKVVKEVTWRNENLDKLWLVNKKGKICASSNKAEIGSVVDIADKTCQICHREPSEIHAQTVIFNDKGRKVFCNVSSIRNEPICQNQKCHDSSEKVLGVVITDIPMTGAQEQFSSNFRKIVCSGVIILCALCLTMIVVLRRLVISPIQKLLRATQEIGSGNLSHRIQRGSEDEIGALVDSFNEMAGQLSLSQRKLEKWNQELQKEVAKRTQEIQRNADDLYAANRKINELILGAFEGREDVLFEDPHLTRCWEHRNCEKKECPAHGSENPRCWQIGGAFCNGAGPTGELAMKLGDCRKCEVYQKGAGFDAITEIGENFNNMIFRLKTKEKALIESFRRLEAQTEQLQKANEEVRTAHEQMLQAHKLTTLGEVASGVAHDFNNVLAVILGYVQILKRKSDGGKVGKMLDAIETAGEDGAAIVRRLQNFAKKRLDDERFVPLDVNEIVQDVVELTKHIRKNREQDNGVTIEAETELGKVRAISGSASQLREVLSNLIINATDAMPQGGKITITTEVENQMTKINVKDTGAGMSEEVQENIFKPFFTTKGVKGNGLGLSVSYRIIRRHKGAIHVQSEVGKGTEFTIVLPVCGVELSQESAPLEHTNADTNPLNEVLLAANGRTRALIVDDEPEVCEILSDMLMTSGWEVKSATSGREALCSFRDGNYDVVFTDLSMPQMSGWKVAEEIKRTAPETTLVLCTVWKNEVSEDRLVEYDVEACIGKPFKQEDILGVAARINDKKQPCALG